MKASEGQYIKTRDGSEVFITFIHGTNPFNGELHPWPIVGWHETLGASVWTKNGNYNIRGESKNDLLQKTAVQIARVTVDEFKEESYRDVGIAGINCPCCKPPGTKKELRKRCRTRLKAKDSKEFKKYKDKDNE